MSRTLKKKKHWSGKVVDCAVSWGNLGDFGSVVEVLGGAEVGQFPHLGQMKLDVLVCHVGKLPYYGDVLLEVNGTPVSGLTNRDTLAVIRHFREPIRLKTVKPEAAYRRFSCYQEAEMRSERGQQHWTGSPGLPDVLPVCFPKIVLPKLVGFLSCCYCQQQQWS
ncbi:Membrane-associated guanylate kinase, WW and PDZ domain-containing protein 3 [Takifugu flavidus]|uniref:Membrane-associated guanylate kinase, WW and PDZ domain-containing protein 3 n=1 Tax=Takifugu flavidus TaxID=433684 RepID=A0A5C6N4W2_9TELE|nr:Membrane-associated guanylate kinase, WW and PDZ domain-containing protein 3 [Takifugu flavidus]